MAPTKKQQQVYEALLFLLEKGERPTVREVGALAHLSSPATVMKHLQALEREGLISMSGKSRGIEIRRHGGDGPSSPPETSSGPSSPLGPGAVIRRVGIPMVGRIAAGYPIAAVAERRSAEEMPADDFDWGEPGISALPTGLDPYPKLSIDPGVFAGSGDLMALQVAGDSMIEAGILSGDYVIIRRQPTVEDGEIAAIDVAGEVTLKRWHRAAGAPGAAAAEQGQSVRLVAANARFAPIEITADDHKEVRILGKYVGLIRGEVQLL